MIQFNRFVLANGLRVLVHEDHSTPMAVVNVMYDVGSRDEDPEKTGFAHLFEHLMFGGSINIPDYDEPLQRAGGENNAYTTNDLTNYYCQLPAENIEKAKRPPGARAAMTRCRASTGSRAQCRDEHRSTPSYERGRRGGNTMSARTGRT